MFRRHLIKKRTTRSGWPGKKERTRYAAWPVGPMNNRERGTHLPRLDAEGNFAKIGGKSGVY